MEGREGGSTLECVAGRDGLKEGFISSPYPPAQDGVMVAVTPLTVGEERQSAEGKNAAQLRAVAS